jgi:hypothetical protein
VERLVNIEEVAANRFAEFKIQNKEPHTLSGIGELKIIFY